MSAAAMANTSTLEATLQGSSAEEARAGAPAATIPSRKLGRRHRRPTDEEARAQFEEFLGDYGLRVPERLVADGEFHRIARAGAGESAKDSDGSATYKLHLDGWPAGGVNDFRGTGFTKWKAKSVEEATVSTPRCEPHAEASTPAARPDSTVANTKPIDEEIAARAAAWERAAAIWAAGDSTPDTHPYLLRKGVQAHGLRVHARGGALIVPLHRVEDDAITGLQFIPAEPGAKKKYMKHSAPTGAAYRIGDVTDVTDVIAIAEGFATAASVHEATGWTVLVAFTCSNLEPVAVAARVRWSEARLVIVADNDVWKLRDGTTTKNAGEFHARKAARAAGAHLAVAPVEELPDAKETHPTDWNDVARVWPREKVRARLEAALTSPVGVGADLANRPTIVVEGGTLPAQVRQAMEALRAANETDSSGGYFVRGKDLLRVVRQRTPRVKRGVTLQPEVSYLSRVTFPHLYGRLAETVRWLQYDARKRGLVEADPPKLVAQMILAHEGTEAPGRPLVAAITAPTLRPDGTILDRPGYDDETGLYYDPGTISFPAVPETPTREDAMKALQVLAHPFSEYRFEASTHHSVVLAAVLTCVVRRTLAIAPIVLVDAPSQSHGKTLLAHSIAMACTGAPAASLLFTPNSEELEKRLTTVLLEGAPVALIDNVTGVLGGDWLAGAVTNEQVKVRIFGALQSQTIPTSTFWIVTANNGALSEDLAVRALTARVDAGVPDPAARTFQIHLPSWMAANWPRMVSAALTVLRAYHMAGRPRRAGTAPWAKFSEWDGLIRGALLWLDQPDPIDTMRTAVEAAPERTALCGLLEAVSALFGGARWEGKRLLVAASTDLESLNSQRADDGLAAATQEQQDALRTALMQVGNGRGVTLPSSVSLGTWLTAHRGKWGGGLRLLEAGTHQRAKLYQVARET